MAMGMSAELLDSMPQIARSKAPPAEDAEEVVEEFIDLEARSEAGLVSDVEVLPAYEVIEEFVEEPTGKPWGGERLQDEQDVLGHELAADYEVIDETIFVSEPIPMVSASLEIRLMRPAKVGQEITIKGWVESQKGRLINTAARLEDSEGNVLSEATGKCVRVKLKEDGSVEKART